MGEYLEQVFLLGMSLSENIFHQKEKKKENKSSKYAHVISKLCKLKE